MSAPKTAPRTYMSNVDAESSAQFTKQVAAQMVDDLTDKPILPEFRMRALPVLRAAWQDANDAVSNAVRMQPPQNPPPDADFLFRVVEPDIAQVATAWPLTDRARQFVGRQNSNLPDRIISGHQASLRQALEREGFRIAENP